MRARLAVAWALLATGPAAAEVEVSALGPARTISMHMSGTRDSGTMGLIAWPHPVWRAAADVGLVRFAADAGIARLAFFGLLELESEGKTRQWAPLPRGDVGFWRGQYGYSLALTPAAPRRLCAGSCDLELVLGFRHESEHRTASNEGGESMDYSDRPQIGDFGLLDVAGRLVRGPAVFSGRLGVKGFLPGRSSYGAGAGGDLMARLTRWERAQPFASLFAEGLEGRWGYPDAILVRGLLGIAFPSAYGDILVAAFAESGHRKGLAAFSEERSIGLGVQLAPLAGGKD